MKIVLLSGGSGKRLWPLSNDIRSKQFLKVVKNGDGEPESMLQRVFRQLGAAGLYADVTVATGATQVEAIRGQLGERVSVVVEPGRRDTFPAIALSAAYLYFGKGCAADETVIVLPVDPYVGDGYFRMLKCMDAAVQDGAADIVLMGVKPTYPSEKYGYIIPEKEGVGPGDVTAESDVRRGGCPDAAGGRILPVAKFKEKPDARTAQELIGRGGFWNCGVFAFKLSYLMDIVRAAVACDCYADVERQYEAFERTSFDYAVVEKADRKILFPARLFCVCTRILRYAAKYDGGLFKIFCI